MLDAGDYVRCLRLGIDASLRSIKTRQIDFPGVTGAVRNG